MKRIFSILFALMVALGLALPMAAPATAHTVDEPEVKTLYAGQNINAGTVNVWNDGTNLYVQYNPSAPWVMTGSHLYVGKTDPADFPSTPGQFPYSPGMEKSPSPGASYNAAALTYTIPLAEIYEYEFVGKGQGKGLNAVGTPGVEPDDEIYIAAHAELVVSRDGAVEQEETAWAEGIPFGKNWAMYFTYRVQGPSLDLTIDKTVDNPIPGEGDTIHYNIWLGNLSPDTTTTGLVVSDLLPEGVTFVSSLTGRGTYDSNTGIWNVGYLEPSSYIHLQITVTVDRGTAGHTITNTATLTAVDQTDSDSADITVMRGDNAAGPPPE